MAVIEQVGVLALNNLFSNDPDQRNIVSLLKESLPEEIELLDATVSGFDLLDFISRKRHLIVLGSQGIANQTIGQVFQWRNSTGEGPDNIIFVEGKPEVGEEIRSVLNSLGLR